MRSAARSAPDRFRSLPICLVLVLKICEIMKLLTLSSYNRKIHGQKSYRAGVRKVQYTVFVYQDVYMFAHLRTTT